MRCHGMPVGERVSGANLPPLFKPILAHAHTTDRFVSPKMLRTIGFVQPIIYSLLNINLFIYNFVPYHNYIINSYDTYKHMHPLSSLLLGKKSQSSLYHTVWCQCSAQAELICIRGHNIR